MTTKKQFHITSFFTATKHATPEDRLKAVFAAEEAREQQCVPLAPTHTRSLFTPHTLPSLCIATKGCCKRLKRVRLLLKRREERASITLERWG